MLQTRRIGNGLCAVSFYPNEIMVRRCGKENFGKEKRVVKLDGNAIYIYDDVASDFGISVEYQNNNPINGDIYLNPCFGDLWVVDGKSFIKINDGCTIDLDEPEGFIKVGHISGVMNRFSNK